MRAAPAMHGPLAVFAALVLGAVPAAADEAAHVVIADEAPFYPGSQASVPARGPARAGKQRQGHGHRPYHPAPGIIVDVLDEQGSVLPGLQRAARNVGYWPFRRCYEEGLRRNQELTGTVSVDLHVLPEGTAMRTELTGTTVKDEVVATCVAREAHHLALEPVQTPVLAKLRVKLAIGDEPVPAPWAVPHADELRAELRSQWSAIAQCYEATLARHPDAGGRMELRFDVAADGSLAGIAEAGTHFEDPEATRCVLGVYRTAALASVPRELRGKGFGYAIHFEPRPAVLPVAL